jgi:hypothetical protein
MALKKTTTKTKTTKHTIEFSNNTRRPRNKTRDFWPLARSTDVEGSHRNGFPSGMPPRSPNWPGRSDSIKLRDRKLRVK